MMKRIIKELALKNGIADIGFVKAREFIELKEIARKQVPFLKGSEDERINPFLINNNAKSIIVFICPYFSGNYGNVSSYAMGKDYHMVLKDKAQPIINQLCLSGFSADFFCDNSPLNERFLACSAGLGFIGKNGFLINNEYGSYVFIGHIITDAEFEYDKPIEMSCVGCDKCIKSCPTGALMENEYNAEKCISYITQKKSPLNEFEISAIKNSLMCWGCDACQKVCPHNGKKTNISQFTDDLITDIKSIECSNREFKKMYADRAFSWRGKGVIERNLKIINNIKTKD